MRSTSLRHCVVTLFLLGAGEAASADIYSFVDSAGVTHFTNVPVDARYRLLLLTLVGCTAPLIAARSVPAGLALSLVAGLAIAPMFSCQYALVGRAATAGSETEAFTWVTAALVGGLAAGSAAGGAVAAQGVSAPFLLSCAATTLAAALATVVAGRRPARVA